MPSTDTSASWLWLPWLPLPTEHHVAPTTPTPEVQQMVQPTGERIGNRPNPPHLHRASSYTMSHVFSASETRVTVPVNHLLARYSSKLWSVDARYRALTRAPTLGSQLAIVFACLRSRVSGRCDIDWGDRGTALLALRIPTGKIRRGPKGRPPPPIRSDKRREPRCYSYRGRRGRPGACHAEATSPPSHVSSSQSERPPTSGSHQP